MTGDAGKARSKSPIAGHHVLIVEKDYFFLEAMRIILDEAGALVLGPVPNVVQARQILASFERLDGAVLDIDLRERLGAEFADELVAGGTPVVFVTCYNRNTVPARYAQATLCPKPVDPAEVIRALASL